MNFRQIFRQPTVPGHDLRIAASFKAAKQCEGLQSKEETMLMELGRKQTKRQRTRKQFQTFTLTQKKEDRSQVS